MAGSMTRVEANRRNAQKSTGPRTAVGKGASRLNAFRHGLAGDGDVVGPDEDVALIERRGAAFAREFAAEGEAGRLLARRAAVLSVRMERATVQDFAKVAADVSAAREQFDLDRRAMIVGWIAELDEGDPRRALDDLAQTVEGQGHLADAWLDLRARVKAGDAEAVARAETWLDRPDLPGPITPRPTLLDRIAAEADRLLGVIDATGEDYLARSAAACNQAGILASFDPAPDAQRARRYDADAERGMYRALRELREERLAAGPPARGPIAPPPPLIPAPAPAPPPASVDEPAPDLGSFRAEPEDLGSFRSDLPAPLAEPALSRQERRRNRPDLRKLARNRR